MQFAKLNKEGILPEDIKAFERASAVDRVMVEKLLDWARGHTAFIISEI